MSTNVENKLDLLLELQSSINNSFPDQMIHILDKYFPEHRILFWVGPSYESLYLTQEQYHAVYEPKYFRPLIANLGPMESLEDFYSYTTYYYKIDPRQPINLPACLKNRIIVSHSDAIFFDKSINGEMYEHFRSVNLMYKTTIYLYDKNIYLAGVSLERNEALGDFTMDELQTLELVGRFAAPLYTLYLKEVRQSYIRNIYRSYHDSTETGLAIITADLQTVESNKAMLEYCRQIIQSLSQREMTDADISGSDGYLSKTVRLITKNSLPTIHDLEHVIKISNEYYTCKLKPCTLPSLDYKLTQTPYIFIICKSHEENLSLSHSSAQQYTLTHRETDIIDLIDKGYTTYQISKALYISHNTAKNHIANIFKKMEVTNRIEMLNKLNLNN